VHVYVRPEYVDQFILATQENHDASIKEPGNLRFDVLQEPGNVGKFVLYEAYASEEANAKHKETAHYLKWRDLVAPMMAKPREGIKHAILYPQVFV